MAEKSRKSASKSKKSREDEELDEEMADMVFRGRTQELSDSSSSEEVESEGSQDESPKRAATPKRSNAIVRDKKTEEAARKILEQEMSESTPESAPSKSRFFGLIKPKSPKRPPTPKKERHGPHGIQVDKSVEKAIKKIYKREYPDQQLRPWDIPDRDESADENKIREKIAARALTPMHDQVNPRAVVLNKNSEDGVKRYLEEKEGYFFMPETPTLEIIEGKPKKGKVSPKTSPQPGPLFPKEGTRSAQKEDPKNVQGALLTMAQVGTSVACPEVNETKPRIEEPAPTGFFSRGLSLVRSLRNSFRRKKPVEKEPETDIDLSTTTDTSLFNSTSLPSELVDEKTSSSITPAKDMTPSRLEQLDESLSDSFPSEVAEGAVGGVEPQTERIGSPADPTDPSRGKHRTVRTPLETCEEYSETEQLANSFYKNPVSIQAVSPKLQKKHQPSSDVKSKTENKDTLSATPGQKEVVEVQGRPHPRLVKELHMDKYRYANDKEQVTYIKGNRKERGDDGKMQNVKHEVMFIEPIIKKGVLHTPDGDFEADYLKNPNDEVVVVKTIPVASSGKEEKVPVWSGHWEDTCPKHTHSIAMREVRSRLSSDSSSSGSDSDSDLDYTP